MTATAATATSIEVPREAEISPLSLGICLSFGVGTVGVSIVLNTVSVYFPALMSTVLGVSPAIAGALLTASKIYDIFVDVLIGGYSDRVRTRWGRRRPFLLAGALTSFGSLLMIFWVPALEGTALLTYMMVALIIYSTGYALFNVPYLAMPAEMTNTYQQRLNLISYRTAFVGLGQLLSLAVTAKLIDMGGGGTPGYRLMGSVMAVIALTTMLICVIGTSRARTLERASGHGFSWAEMKSFFANKPMMMLMGAKLTQYISFGIMQPANLLFLLNVLKTGYAGMIHLSVVQNVVVFASMPIWVRLGKIFGKRNCYLAGVLIMIPASLSWYGTTPDIQMWEIWIRAGVFGFGSAGSLLMSTSMLPDAMEYDRLRTGLRREGLVASLYCINEKLGFAIGALILGGMLTAAGYIPTMGGKLVEQPASAIDALFAVKAFVPATALTVGLVLIWLYRLNQKMLDDAAKAGPVRA